MSGMNLLHRIAYLKTENSLCFKIAFALVSIIFILNVILYWYLFRTYNTEIDNLELQINKDKKEG